MPSQLLRQPSDVRKKLKKKKDSALDKNLVDSDKKKDCCGGPDGIK